MIIGICGLIGSGKGTVADVLVEEHKFEKISFADKLKDAVSVLFDWLCNSFDFDRLDHAHRGATRAVIDMERFHQTRPVAADAHHFRDAQAHA